MDVQANDNAEMDRRNSSQSGNAIRTIGLTKHFGSVRALDGLDLQVREGETFGFIGPNGAGKSTAIRILLDLIRPTAGTAEVYGRQPHEHGAELRSAIGYLPGELRMPGQSTAGDYLSYLARLRGGQGKSLIKVLSDRFDLDLSRQISKLSKGNKQKIGLVQAFMHRPSLLILDEPTSGLDPLLQREFHALARERTATGATIFMSSHILSEVEEVADRVAVIRSGRLVDVDDLHQLRRRAGQSVVFRFGEPVDGKAFSALGGVSDVSVDIDRTNAEWVVRCVLRGEPDDLLKLAARHHVAKWNATDRDLEDLFIDFYRDQTASAPSTVETAPVPARNEIEHV